MQRRSPAASRTRTTPSVTPTSLGQAYAVAALTAPARPRRPARELPAQPAVPERRLPAQLQRQQDRVVVSRAPTTPRRRSTPPRSPDPAAQGHSVRARHRVTAPSPTQLVAGRQAAVDGAWGGDPGGSAENANTTGLAAWALGNTAQSAKGAGWLRDHQATYYDYCTKLKNDVGAVAYDAAALSAGRSGGITTGSQDQCRRATAQAVPGLQYLQATPSRRDRPDRAALGFLKAGHASTLPDDRRVHAATELCLTAWTPPRGSTVRRRVPGPGHAVRAGTGRPRTFTVQRPLRAHRHRAASRCSARRRLACATPKYRVKRSSFGHRHRLRARARRARPASTTAGSW